MRSRFLLFALFAVLALACESALPPPPSAPASTVALPADRIQLLATGDIHGHLEAERIAVGEQSFERGGVALLAAHVARQRARAPDRTLLLDAGDAWQGTFISNANRGAAVVQAMNRMGYDAQVLGNHDFDWGQEVLKQRAAEARFPFLAANVVEVATGQPPSFVRPYVVKEIAGARIGILGIAYPSAAIINAKAIQGLRLLPAEEAVQRFLVEVRARSDFVIVLAHLADQENKDLKLARDVPGLDLIVSGHVHVAPARLSEGQTLIVRPGFFAQQLTRLDAAIDPATKRLASISRPETITVATTPRLGTDPEIARLVADRAAEAKAVSERVIGRTLVALPHVTRGESATGNLVTDAMLEYCQTQGWQSELALHNGAGIRAAIPAGDIRFGQLYEVLPFDNVVVSVDLTGEQLQQALNRNGRTGNLLIAGGRYAFSGSDLRAQDVTIGSGTLETVRTYRVCTIDYLALGGDGLSMLTPPKNILYGDLTADVVADYITRHSPVAPKIEGRMPAPAR